MTDVPITKVSIRRGSGRESVVTLTTRFPNGFMYSETLNIKQPSEVEKLLKEAQTKAKDASSRHTEMQIAEERAMATPHLTE